jgi:thiamine phosphate synthase YjbQ (UPF0047 family)
MGLDYEHGYKEDDDMPAHLKALGWQFGFDPYS